MQRKSSPLFTLITKLVIYILAGRVAEWQGGRVAGNGDWTFYPGGRVEQRRVSQSIILCTYKTNGSVGFKDVVKIGVVEVVDVEGPSHLRWV